MNANEPARFLDSTWPVVVVVLPPVMGMTAIRTIVDGWPAAGRAGDRGAAGALTMQHGQVGGSLSPMAWVKVPRENHPIFHAALPKDPRIETLAMFGGVAAKVNGNLFAGLFGRSTMLLLAEPDRAAALALDGASLFDPMGDGRVRSDKVMLPERMMRNPAELRRWIAKAFAAAALLPKKVAKKTGKKTGGGAAKGAKKTRATSKRTALRKESQRS